MRASSPSSAAHGLVPPTIVIDDGWQESYGLATPDPVRWPDLALGSAGVTNMASTFSCGGRRGIRRACPRNSASATPLERPSPWTPAFPRHGLSYAKAVHEVLSPAGLDADGLKVDFTARTPTGRSLTGAGGPWGIALLHDLLSVVYGAAKKAKSDALVITQAPHPAFADVADMIRLNDMMRLDDPHPETPLVAQMRYRASVVRASCPDLLIDTDDWCAPDLAQWRQYLAVKSELGVPALYYTTHLDRTGEALEEADYEALRELWSRSGQPQNR